MKKEESAHFGQTIRTESSPDRSSAKDGMQTAVMGNPMPDRGTSHSLNPEMYNDKPMKPRR
jgi:hypothetical protein